MSRSIDIKRRRKAGEERGGLMGREEVREEKMRRDVERLEEKASHKEKE